MQKTTFSILLIVALGLAILPACGGGSSSSAPQPQVTTAVMTLSTAATSSIPAGTTINSYDVTVTLPSGVTVMTMPAPNSSVTDTGVVKTSGNALGGTAFGVYTAATASFPGTVKVYIYKVDPITGIGFDPGEFCKLSVTVAAGLSAPAANFNVTLDDATGIDSTLSTVTGLQSQLTVTIK